MRLSDCGIPRADNGVLRRGVSLLNASARYFFPARLVCALVFFLCFFTPCGVAADAPEGRPRRIVSLDICSDWMVARHAARAQVAGLSPLLRSYPLSAWSRRDYPAPDWSPDGWPMHDGSLETLVNLRPDLVIVSPYNARLLRERLERLGIRVALLPRPVTIDEVLAYERHFLSLLRLPPDHASQPPLQFPVSRKRLLMLGANGIGTGTETFEHALLTRAGWTNYLDRPGHVQLDLERIVLDPPDGILWVTPEASPEQPGLSNAFVEHPAWRRLRPAPRLVAADHWRWQCPGPWSWELVRQMARGLHEMETHLAEKGKTEEGKP
ncbi:MAG: hypothetical protein LBG69_03950 [Zoogloeaceae bacterium]|jgi:iron complex transport system substrate-binding protein|nr:hypothetical protein [Zoogloeaceae bacterium]